MANYILKEADLIELEELSASSLGVIQKDSGTAMNPNARTLVIGLYSATSIHIIYLYWNCRLQ